MPEVRACSVSESVEPSESTAVGRVHRALEGPEEHKLYRRGETLDLCANRQKTNDIYYLCFLLTRFIGNDLNYGRVSLDQSCVNTRTNNWDTCSVKADDTDTLDIDALALSLSF